MTNINNKEHHTHKSNAIRWVS